jgi:hypothetical protein
VPQLERYQAHTLATTDGTVRHAIGGGFGWPTLAAWTVIWAAGMAAAAPAALARKRQPQQITAPITTP